MDALKVPSLHMAADGGSYGFLVTDYDVVTDDAIGWNFTSNGLMGSEHRIDRFKLGYRYSEVDDPERMERLLSEVVK